MSVADHRLFKYFRDNMKREQQLRAALARIQQQPPTPTPARGSKPSSKKPAAPSARVSRHEREVERMLSSFNNRS
jgi:hypothetical protein